MATTIFSTAIKKERERKEKEGGEERGRREGNERIREKEKKRRGEKEKTRVCKEHDLLSKKHTQQFHQILCLMCSPIFVWVHFLLRLHCVPWVHAKKRTKVSENAYPLQSQPIAWFDTCTFPCIYSLVFFLLLVILIVDIKSHLESDVEHPHLNFRRWLFQLNLGFQVVVQSPFESCHFPTLWETVLHQVRLQSAKSQTNVCLCKALSCLKSC